LNRKELLAQSIFSPSFFGRIFLGGEYTPDQERVLDSVSRHDRTSVHSGHATGKSRAAADIALWFLHTRKPSKVITTAPTWPQVEKILWSEIRTRFHGARVNLGSTLPPRDCRMRISDDHFAMGISTDRSERMQGFHSPNQLIIIDEAAGVDGKTWEGVERISSGGNVKILAIGNPGDPAGPFYDACTSRIWNTLHLDCLDHPNVTGRGNYISGAVTKRWCEERLEEWGPESPMYISQVRGLFPEQIDSLIALSWVEKALILEGHETGGPITIGCDVARYGDDETVLAILDGAELIELMTYQGRDLMKTAGNILAVRNRYWPTREVVIVVDDVGLGGGVVDRLREQGVDVVGFNAGLPPRYKEGKRDLRRERFVNLRSQAWWGLRLALQGSHLKLLDDPRLRSQLVSPTYGMRSNGLIEVERKEDMKKRGFPSPDRGDALMMAWWGRELFLYLGIAVPEKTSRRDRSWRSEFDEVTGRGSTPW